MSMLDLTEDAEEQTEDDENDGSDSGTYIHFISGPNHRDWNDDWPSHVADEIAEAYQVTAPSAEGLLDDVGAYYDRHHLAADVLVAVSGIFRDHDFQPILDLLLGTGDDPDEAYVKLYSRELAKFMADNPEVARATLEKLDAGSSDSDDEAEQKEDTNGDPDADE